MGRCMMRTEKATGCGAIRTDADEQLMDLFDGVSCSDKDRGNAPTAVGYAWASRREGFRALATQHSQIEEHAKEVGLTLVHSFGECGHGNIHKRTLREVVSYCSEHEIDYLLVTSTDRIAGSDDIIERFMVLLKESGTTLIDLSAPDEYPHPDTGGYPLKDDITLYQTALHSERTRSGMLQAKKEGRLIHRPPVGYRVSRTSRVEPDSEMAPFVQLAFELFGESQLSMPELIDALEDRGFRNPRTGKPYLPSSIKGILSNTFYAGLIWVDCEEGFSKANFAPLVDPALFNLVQMRLRTRASPLLGSDHGVMSFSKPNETPGSHIEG